MCAGVLNPVPIGQAWALWPGNVTVFKDVEHNLGRLPHYIRWVLDIAGVGPVVCIRQVVDDDGAIFPMGVSNPFDAFLENPDIVDIWLAFGIMKYLDGGESEEDRNKEGVRTGQDGWGSKWGV